MATQTSSRTKSSSKKGDAAIRDAARLIEDNPMTSAVIALAAGVVATSIFKMTVGSTNGVGHKVAAPAVKKAPAKPRPRAKKKSTVRKTRAKSR